MKRNLRLYGSALASFGGYACSGSGAAAGPEQRAQHVALSVTLHGTYTLHRDGRRALADHARAVLFNRGDVYRTSHPEGCGDRGYFFSFRPDVAAEVLARHDARVADRPGRPFAALEVPLGRRAALLAAELFRDVRRDGARPGAGLPGTLEYDERALHWLDEVFASASAPRAERAEREPPSRAHRDLVHEARQLLALHYAEPLGLAGLAARLGVSPFHLSRVFRRVTGTTIHRQLEGQRLAAALDAVSDPQRDLTRIAFECGFSSHSHFTARFRRAFGMAPARFRRARS